MSYEDAKTAVFDALVPRRLCLYYVPAQKRHYLVGAVEDETVTVMIVQIVQIGHGFEQLPLHQWWSMERLGNLVRLSDHDRDAVLLENDFSIIDGRLKSTR